MNYKAMRKDKLIFQLKVADEYKLKQDLFVEALSKEAGIYLSQVESQKQKLKENLVEITELRKQCNSNSDLEHKNKVLEKVIIDKEAIIKKLAISVDSFATLTTDLISTVRVSVNFGENIKDGLIKELNEPIQKG